MALSSERVIQGVFVAGFYDLIDDRRSFACFGYFTPQNLHTDHLQWLFIKLAHGRLCIVCTEPKRHAGLIP